MQKKTMNRYLYKYPFKSNSSSVTMTATAPVASVVVVSPWRPLMSSSIVPLVVVTISISVASRPIVVRIVTWIAIALVAAAAAAPVQFGTISVEVPWIATLITSHVSVEETPTRTSSSGSGMCHPYPASSHLSKILQITNEMAAHTHPYIPSVAFMAAFAAFLSLNTANPKQGVLLVIHTSFNSPNGANTFSKSDFLTSSPISAMWSL
jgi:hypothetical protein